MPDLGTFSVSLSVQDLTASRQFYESLGFEQIGGDPEQGWLILRSGTAIVGLFQGMFESNLLTFNPQDVRTIQAHLESQGISVELRHEMGEETDPSSGAPAGESGPAHFTLTDPDGNVLLFDQF